MIQVGSPSDLKRKVSELSTIEVETQSISNDQIEKLRAIGEICRVEYENPILRISCERDDDLTERVAKILLSEGVKIKSIATKEPTLEETFIKLTGGEDEIDRFLEKATGRNQLNKSSRKD